jgi:hypothetical protein
VKCPTKWLESVVLVDSLKESSVGADGVQLVRLVPSVVVRSVETTMTSWLTVVVVIPGIVRVAVDTPPRVPGVPMIAMSAPPVLNQIAVRLVARATEKLSVTLFPAARPPSRAKTANSEFP